MQSATGENSKKLQPNIDMNKNTITENVTTWLLLLIIAYVIIFLSSSILLLFGYSFLTVIVTSIVFFIPIVVIAFKMAVVFIPQDRAYSANVLFGAELEEDGYKKPAIYTSGFNIWNPFHIKNDEANLTTIDATDTTQLECGDGVPIEGEFEIKGAPDPNNLWPYFRLGSSDSIRRKEAERILLSSAKGVMNSKAREKNHDLILGEGRNTYTKSVFASYDDKNGSGGRRVEKANGLQMKSVVVSNLNMDPATLEAFKQKTIALNDLSAAEEYLKIAEEKGEKMTLDQAVEKIHLSRKVITKNIDDNRHTYDFPPGTENFVGLTAIGSAANQNQKG